MYMYRSYFHFIRTILQAIIFSLFLVPSFTFAQSTTNQAYQDTLNKLLLQQQQVLQQATSQNNPISKYLDIKTTPPLPGPNAPVTISIESYIIDLYKTSISWAVDGTVLLKGIGKTTFSFQNGPSGKTTTVTLSIVTSSGELISKDFSFNPAGVSIMWEADTYTPPFYKGKPLMVPQALIRIVATPDTIRSGSPFGAGDLVYDWRRDDATDSTASGYLKNVYSFMGPKPLTNTKITLGVSSLDGSSQSEMELTLPQVRPFVLFYEKDPLLGVWYNSPLKNEATLTKKEISINAEPYFFSNEGPAEGSAPTLKYTWSVNGSIAQTYGREITLRNDTGVKGSSLVSLSMRGLFQTFQSASKDLKINFTESSSSGIPIF